MIPSLSCFRVFDAAFWMISSFSRFRVVVAAFPKRGRFDSRRCSALAFVRLITGSSSFARPVASVQGARAAMNVKTFLRFLSALVVVTVTVLPAATAAHFKLMEPASWINSDQRGDPQKVGPCGGDPKGGAENEKLLTNTVTKVTGGSKLHLKIQETIYHSGHYRVALAVNSRNELPGDPVVTEKYTERGVYSVWAAIQSPPQIPVLADGLFPH